MAARGDRATGIAEGAVNLEGVLGCEVIDQQGTVLARANRGLNLSSDWMEIDGILPGVVWGAISRAETAFGKAELVVVEYENVRIVGFTVLWGELGMILAVSKRSDPAVLKRRILESLDSSNWSGSAGTT